MFGIGVVKGLAVTLREFVQTYVDDIKKIPSRYAGGRTEIDQSQAASTQTGLFTIQYPEEHRRLPERFRYVPMLIYDADTGEDRCTACGICAKVCPPQCIWIVRDRDANGKPITRPAAFDIDATICMNCGLCAEYCPFDAIKMNHEFEIAAYTRMPDLVFTLKELRVPTTYYAKLYPTAWTEEEAERAAKAKEKEARTAAPAARPASAPAAASAPVLPRSPSSGGSAAEGAAGPSTAPAGAAPAAAGGRLTPEELERRRAEAKARKAAQQAAGEAVAPAAEAPAAETASAAQAPAPAPAPAASGGRLSPEEIERRRAEARARKAAQQAAESGNGATGDGQQ